MRPSIRNPIIILCLTALTFIVAQTILFRSGAYMAIMSPDSVAGKMRYFAHLEKNRCKCDTRDVLLVGDSRMEWAFSPVYFAQKFPDSGLRIIEGGVAGAPMEALYFMIRYLDPKRERYAAVVVPMAGYKTIPVGNEQAGRTDTAQILSAILPLKDLPKEIGSFSDPQARIAAIYFDLFPEHALASDIQNFLMNPSKRMDSVLNRYKDGIYWNYDNPGPQDDISELKFDVKAQKILKYPKYFDSFKHRESDGEFTYLGDQRAAELTEKNSRYFSKWAGKITQYYQGTATKVIFIQMPMRPIAGVKSLTPLPDAVDVRDTPELSHNAIVLPEDYFSDLEAPQYFYDTLHLNHKGRVRFSGMLGKALIDTLGSS